MLLRLKGTIKDYSWGSRSLIPDYFNQPQSPGPIAEVWYGTHPLGMSETETGEKLAEAYMPLPFLLKLLSANSPLSIQVHPSTEQAKAGFDRENAAGIALDDPARNYKDQSHKPEILIALSEFRALCGFRPIAQIVEILSGLSSLSARFGELAKELEQTGNLAGCFEALISESELLQQFLALPVDSNSSEAIVLAHQLSEHYPSDNGVLVSLMLNYVSLQPGEAIFLPAGNLHAYLQGLGVEVMAASDNVIRGGLTSKHIDKQELINIIDFHELKHPKVAPKKLASGLIEYPVSVSDFRVYRAELSGANYLADLEISSEVMVLCSAGEIALSTGSEMRSLLHAGDVVLVTETKMLSLGGSGVAFLVSRG